MQFSYKLCTFIVLSAPLCAQTRTELANRFGSPWAEIFLLPHNVKLTATYDSSDTVCGFRIETPHHSERVAPNLTDARYWIDSQHVTPLIAELPGAVQCGLRPWDYGLASTC